MRPRRVSFTGMYLILLLAQMVICNYFHLTYYVTLSLLPALILFLPTRIGTVGAMLIAAATGLLVDSLAEGLPGLNMFALVPVAFARRSILSLVCGSELYANGENLSMKKHGTGTVITVLLIGEALFLLLYIWADSAGTTPFWFNLLRFLFSLVAGVLLCLMAGDLLSDNSRD